MAQRGFRAVLGHDLEGSRVLEVAGVGFDDSVDITLDELGLVRFGRFGDDLVDLFPAFVPDI